MIVDVEGSGSGFVPKGIGDGQRRILGFLASGFVKFLKRERAS